MTHDELIALLALVTAFDQRTVGEADLEAWGYVADAENWTYAHAQQAVKLYHRSGAGKSRITPAAITDTLTDVRTAIRKRLFQRDITPPRELLGDVRAELAWRREYTSDAIATAMDDWARDGRMPEPLGEPVAASEMPATAQTTAIRDYSERFALRTPRATEPADPNQRRAAIEAARAELDQRRNADGGIA